MAANTEIIEIQIVLDDGKTQKGFLDLSKSSKAFGESVKKNVGGELKESTDIAGQLFSKLTSQLSKYRSALSGIGGVIAVATAAYAAFVRTTEASVVADRLKQINTQFDVLASRSGASAAQLEDGFRRAANGLVSMNDILASSNKALGSLEISADTLQKTFEIARKASRAFGVDTLEAYEALNSAVLSGNTRQLRQLGLFIDAGEAAKKYGKEIGVAANFLNEAGRQQALFNAINAKAEDVYAGVANGVVKNSTASKQLKVALQELSEATDILIDKTSGKAASQVNSFFVSIVDGITKIISPKQAPRTLEEALINIQREQEELRAKIAEANKYIQDQAGSLNSLSSNYGIAQQELKRYNYELVKSQAEEERISMQLMKKAQAIQMSTDAQASALEQEKQNNIDREALMAKQRAQESEMLALQLSNSQAREALAITDQAKQLEVNLQKELIESQHKIAIEEINKKHEEGLFASKAQFNSAMLAIDESFRLKSIAAEQKRVEQVKQLNQTYRSIIAGGIVAGVQAMTNALIKGEKGFDNFAKAVLGIIGDMAIQLGSFFIAQGIAQLALASNPLTAGGAIVAAGVGLVALGTLLKALSGSGGADTGGVVAGGGTGGDGGVALAGEAPTAERTDPSSKINVNIQGNVLDRRQTGLEIVEVLREQFDTQGGRSIVGLT